MSQTQVLVTSSKSLTVCLDGGLNVRRPCSIRHSSHRSHDLITKALPFGIKVPRWSSINLNPKIVSACVLSVTAV